MKETRIHNEKRSVILSLFKKKIGPWIAPEADSCLVGFNDFHRVSKYFISGPFCSISIGVSLHPETADDMDRRAFLQFGEVLNMVSFPCDDTMPRDINDLGAVFCGIAVVSCDGEVGNFGVHEILHVNAPDDAPEDVPCD